MGLFGKKKQQEEPCTCGTCSSAPAAAAVTQGTKTFGEGKTVKVLGSGCQKCNQLEENTKAALLQLGITAEIEHVTDFGQIAAYGVMRTPALVVNEKVILFGRVAKANEIAGLLQKEWM